MFDFQQPYDRRNAVAFLKNTLLPDDFVHSEESIQPEFAPQHAKKMVLLGKVPSLKLTVYEIRHDSENDPRVGLSRDAFRLLSGFGQSRAVVLFASKSPNYRLSLVTVDLKGKAVKGTTREYSNPRRYSFFLGPDCKPHTPSEYLIKKNRVKDFDDLKGRFSIEVVNKEFYTQIAVLFTKLVGGSRKVGSKSLEVKKGSLYLPQTDDDKTKKEFAVRLIGRLIFCWFLKKKKSAQSIPLIPEELLSSYSAGLCSKLGGFYHGVLEPLFFEVLNTPVDQRNAACKKDPWDKIPFLNGGLFTPHDHDYYELNDQGGTKHLNTLKVPGDWLTELLIVFETYNFTIDENTPVDIELSIEPEMLGRIFENLLAEINPQTGETARKSTGSYYTPRPIVEYMVDESLKQYLLTKTGIAEETLAGLLSYSEPEGNVLTETQSEAVIDALHKIKIIDPACGSGAFPMGILQKILLILQKLDPDSKKWLDKLLSGIPDPMYKKELKRKISQPNYLHKLGIIRDCIFGIDIQAIAIEISKLRCFLSLVVDEKVEDTAENRGIEPLPNLEFKFVCANSLVGLGGEMFLTTEAHRKIDELKNIRDQYLRSYGPEKNKLEAQFTALKSELAKMSLNWSHGSETLLKLASWEPFKDTSCGWFDPEWMFGFKSGFDIIIANPPYIVLSSELLNGYSLTKGNSNTYIAFLELAMRHVKNQGIISYIIPTTWLSGNNFLDFRKTIISRKSILQIIQLPYDIFNAYIDNVILFLGGESIKNNNAKTFRFEIKDDVRKELNYEMFPLSRWAADSEYIIYLNKGLTQILSKYKKVSSVFLSKIADVQRGTLPPQKEELYPTKKDKGGNLIPWFTHQVYRYYVKMESLFYVDYEKLRENKPIELFSGEKLLGRQLISRQFRLQFAYFNETAAFKKNLYAIYNLKKGYHYYYLLGLLNSKFYSFIQVNLNTSGQRDDFPSFSLQDYRNFLIPDISKADQEKFVVLVEKIVSLQSKKKGNDDADDQFQNVDNQLDQMIYELYGLTAEEIAVVENSVR